MVAEPVGGSAITQRPDASLKAFAERPLTEPFPYLIVDARYETVREAGVVASQAVLIAVGIGWDGRRQILAVAMANRESRSSWKDFLLGPIRRRTSVVRISPDAESCRRRVRALAVETHENWMEARRP